jgi:hypothetical protein
VFSRRGCTGGCGTRTGSGAARWARTHRPGTVPPPPPRARTHAHRCTHARIARTHRSGARRAGSSGTATSARRWVPVPTAPILWQSTAALEACARTVARARAHTHPRARARTHGCLGVDPGGDARHEDHLLRRRAEAAAWQRRRCAVRAWIGRTACARAACLRACILSWACGCVNACIRARAAAHAPMRVQPSGRWTRCWRRPTTCCCTCPSAQPTHHRAQPRREPLKRTQRDTTAMPTAAATGARAFFATPHPPALP